jgi:hypothetical protein
MNTLFTFGCSYTADFESNNLENYRKYKEYRGGTYPKSWPILLSEKMGMNIKNYGIGGTGNQSIFEEFCIHCDEINENDVVIIEWSFIHRYRMALDNSWYHLTLGRPTIEKFNEINDTIIENRTNDLYVDEIFNFIKLINQFSKSKKFKVFYWFADDEMKKRLSKDMVDIEKYISWEKSMRGEINFRGGITIKEETNNIVDDTHFGELGHQIQSDIIYDYIKQHIN